MAAAKVDIPISAWEFAMEAVDLAIEKAKSDPQLVIVGLELLIFQRENGRADIAFKLVTAKKPTI